MGKRKRFRPFEECRAYARSLKLRNQKEWKRWSATCRPADIPSAPDRNYAGEGWNGWADFLGTKRANRGSKARAASLSTQRSAAAAAVAADIHLAPAAMSAPSSLSSGMASSANGMSFGGRRDVDVDELHRAIKGRSASWSSDGMGGGEVDKLAMLADVVDQLLTQQTEPTIKQESLSFPTEQQRFQQNFQQLQRKQHDQLRQTIQTTGLGSFQQSGQTMPMSIPMPSVQRQGHGVLNFATTNAQHAQSLQKSNLQRQLHIQQMQATQMQQWQMGQNMMGFAAGGSSA